MKKLITLIFIGSFALFASAQTQVPAIPQTGVNYPAFIPADYDTLQNGIAYGDLDGDGREDIALALHNAGKEDNDGDMDSDPARIILVLLKTDNGYKLASKSVNSIMCKHCGGVFGDPFESISIKNKVLIISHYGGSNWRWSMVSKYRYQNNGMFLIGFTNYAYYDGKRCEKLNDYSGVEFTDVNLVTGDRVRKSITENCILKLNKKDKIKVVKLVRLDNYVIDQDTKK